MGRLPRHLVLACALATLSACVTVEGTLKADGSGTLEIVYPVMPTTTERLEKRRLTSPQITLDSLSIKEDGMATAKLSFDDPAKLTTADMFRTVKIDRHREGGEERLTITLTNAFNKEVKEEGKPGPKFTFHLPGKVLEANRNATIDGSTVSWHFTLAEFVNQKTVDLMMRYQVPSTGDAAPAGAASKPAAGDKEPSPPK
jgi:hypothetical protein